VIRIISDDRNVINFEKARDESFGKSPRSEVTDLYRVVISSSASCWNLDERIRTSLFVFLGNFMVSFS